MASCVATTAPASLARRAVRVAGKRVWGLLRGLGDWRRAECAAAEGARAPTTLDAFRAAPASPAPPHAISAVLPKRAAASGSLRAAPRLMAVAAAAPPAAATRQRSSNMVLFSRPSSASLLSVNDQVPAAFVAPPATGLPTTPLLVPATPVSYSAGTGDAWRAAPAYVDVNAGVSGCFSGLDTKEWRQVGGAL